MTDQNTTSPSEEPHIEYLRREIEQQYADHPTGCGGSFGELLCYEIHSAGLTFVEIAAKWGLSVSMIGKLVADHCDRMESVPQVKHSKQVASPLEAALTAELNERGWKPSPAPLPAGAAGEENLLKFKSHTGGGGYSVFGKHDQYLGNVYYAAVGGLWSAEIADGPKVRNADGAAKCFPSREAAALALVWPTDDMPAGSQAEPLIACMAPVGNIDGAIGYCGNELPCESHPSDTGSWAVEAQRSACKRCCPTCNALCIQPPGHGTAACLFHPGHPCPSADDSPAKRAAQRSRDYVLEYLRDALIAQGHYANELPERPLDRRLIEERFDRIIAGEHAPLYDENKMLRTLYETEMRAREKAEEQLAESQAWVKRQQEIAADIDFRRMKLEERIEHMENVEADEIATLTSESTTQREQIAGLHVALAAANSELEAARAHGRHREPKEAINILRKAGAECPHPAGNIMGATHDVDSCAECSAMELLECLAQAAFDRIESANVELGRVKAQAGSWRRVCERYKERCRAEESFPPRMPGEVRKTLEQTSSALLWIADHDCAKEMHPSESACNDSLRAYMKEIGSDLKDTLAILGGEVGCAVPHDELWRRGYDEGRRAETPAPPSAPSPDDDVIQTPRAPLRPITITFKELPPRGPRNDFEEPPSEQARECAPDAVAQWIEFMDGRGPVVPKVAFINGYHGGYSDGRSDASAAWAKERAELIRQRDEFKEANDCANNAWHRDVPQLSSELTAERAKVDDYRRDSRELRWLWKAVRVMSLNDPDGVDPRPESCDIVRNIAALASLAKPTTTQEGA